MSDYHISQIYENDKREMKKLDALLKKEGIERDKNLDYTAGLYDDDYQLAATGSCFGNTLRCMAVDSSHQGEGLLNKVVSHLIEYQYSRGNLDLFLYTKCDKAVFFRDLGFYEIARADGKVVFMENRKNGFEHYLENLRKESEKESRYPALSEREGISALRLKTSSLPPAAVVMNANPFTLGHQYLLETASAASGLLHVFVVSEDASLVPFPVRKKLVREGSSHLSNLIFHDTGSYLISSATFPSYFLRDEETVIRSQARLDSAVFARIADALHITARFVGEEPFSQVTSLYNQVMKETLPQSGIDLRVLPRKTAGREAISASSARALIKEGRIPELRELVPESTYRYFISPEAEEVIRAIQNSEEIRHY